MITIRLRPGTREKLDGLKIHPRESYDGLISRLADGAHDDEDLSGDEIAAIRESGEDIREGRVRSLRGIMRDPGDDRAIRSPVK